MLSLAPVARISEVNELIGLGLDPGCDATMAGAKNTNLFYSTCHYELAGLDHNAQQLQILEKLNNSFENFLHQGKEKVQVYSRKGDSSA